MTLNFADSLCIQFYLKLRSVLEVLFLYSRGHAVYDICGVAPHARLVRNCLHPLCYI